jgi:hypothetical protein
MLAYVFWHWPRPDVSQKEYEGHLRAFHEGLAEERPAGLISSSTWRLDAASWLPSGNVYLDWYLLENSCALDTLNRGVVSGQNDSRHNAVASLADAGTAGLYAPARGAAATAEGQTTVWFGKPKGMSYDELYASLDRIDRLDAGSLWRRMMVLGPTAEFCLVGDELPELPPEWSPSVVHRELIWRTER